MRYSRPVRRVALLLLGALILELPAVTPDARADTPTPASSAPPPRPPAPRPPSVAWSMLGGLVTALVPMAVGGSLLGRDTIELQKAGIFTMQTGWALAPFVSHAIAGEWGRGAAFAAPGLVSEMGMLGVFAADPRVAIDGSPGSRVPFWILLCISIGGAGAGLADSFLAPERWKVRWKEHHLTVAPVVGPRQSGLVLGGTF